MYEFLRAVGAAMREDGMGIAEFIVSPIDCGLARDYKWYCNRYGYIYRRSTLVLDTALYKSVNIYLHREIMGLEYGDGLEVDHLDGDPSNNQRGNLEVVTRRENMKRKRDRE